MGLKVRRLESATFGKCDVCKVRRLQGATFARCDIANATFANVTFERNCATFAKSDQIKLSKLIFLN